MSQKESKRKLWPTTKNKRKILLECWCMPQLLIVSMQQLACKLCGCDPVKQFATCPITAMLTYLY